MDSLGTIGGSCAGRKREVRGQGRITEYWDINIFGHDVTEREPLGLSG